MNPFVTTLNVNDFFSSSAHTAYSSALILQFGIPVEINLLIYDTGHNKGLDQTPWGYPH